MRTLARALGATALLIGALSLGGPADDSTRRPLPEPIRQKLSRPIPTPYDQPDAAHAFFYEKRLGGVAAVDPRAEYARARRHMGMMPRYSTRRERLLSPDKGGFTAAAATLKLDAWEPLGPGNIGGRTRVLVIDPRAPKRMYAGGVSGGIWKTTNRGKRWRPVGDEMTNLAVNSLAFDPANPDTIYAGTYGGGVFKSSDGGSNWAATNTGLTITVVHTLAIDPDTPSTIYAGTGGGGTGPARFARASRSA